MEQETIPVDETGGRVLTQDQIQKLVDEWSSQLGVSVARVQVRSMRNKWGSISTAGNLTLSSDILLLPYDLAEYIIVHELMHLKFPNHQRGWQVSMGMYLSDWRDRDRRLMSHQLSRHRAIQSER